MFEPTHINTLARRAHGAVEGDGSGHTIYAIDTPRLRYVVGGLTTRLFPIGEAKATLRAAMHAMAGAYNGVIADTLGYWEDGGTVYVDLGTLHSDLTSAMATAVARNELAIYDTWENKAIPTCAHGNTALDDSRSVYCMDCGISL